MLSVLFEKLPIVGATNIRHGSVRDSRGELSKAFVASAFKAQDIGHEISEIFWSISRKGALRGMHYQANEAPQTKLVSVINGTILDVLLDVRTSSPTYGLFFAQTLGTEDSVSVFVPHGVAHGFQVLSDSATTLYSVSTEYEKQVDLGVRFDSFGFSWPDEPTVVSARDLMLPRFRDA